MFGYTVYVQPIHQMQSTTRTNCWIYIQYTAWWWGTNVPKKQLQWSRGSVLPLSTQVRGFKPDQSRWIFQGEKILSTPSFGREVKPCVPCRRYAACKRSLNWRGSRNFRQNYPPILAHKVPPFATRISRIVGDVGVPGGERGNVETGRGDRASTISQPGCSTSVAWPRALQTKKNMPKMCGGWLMN